MLVRFPQAINHSISASNRPVAARENYSQYLLQRKKSAQELTTKTLNCTTEIGTAAQKITSRMKGRGQILKAVMKFTQVTWYFALRWLASFSLFNPLSVGTSYTIVSISVFLYSSMYCIHVIVKLIIQGPKYQSSDNQSILQ